MAERLSIHRWLYRDKGVLDDNQASVAVRDIDESIEVILLKEIEGEYYLLDRANDGTKVDNVSEQKLAKEVIRLPHVLTLDIERAINHLETITAHRFPEWRESPWLKGSLALVLNGAKKGEFWGYEIEYSSESGLSYKKEGDN